MSELSIDCHGKMERVEMEHLASILSDLMIITSILGHIGAALSKRNIQ